jgi:hypothetical protein
MSEDFQTTAPAVQQTAADTATEQAIDAHISGDTQKATVAFDRASVEHRRSAPPEDGSTPGHGWRDGHEPLAPMPAAPAIAIGEVDAAINKLNERGGDHAALVENWGSDIGANLAYAKSAFADIAATRPDLIQKFERSGLGDDPAVLSFLAQHGRLNAGLMGDHTIARRNNDMTTNPINRAGPTGTNRGGSAREQLDELMAANPPGSDKYKSPAIQRKVESLSRQISGGGSIIGSGGRTS